MEVSREITGKGRQTGRGLESARWRRKKREKIRRVRQYSGASCHRAKEGRVLKQAEGTSRRARAMHGREVSSNSGAQNADERRERVAAKHSERRT